MSLRSARRLSRKLKILPVNRRHGYGKLASVSGRCPEIEPRLLESAYPLACAGTTRAEGSLKQRYNAIEEIHRGISY
jgi:hypothetical protein